MPGYLSGMLKTPYVETSSISQPFAPAGHGCPRARFFRAALVLVVAGGALGVSSPVSAQIDIESGTLGRPRVRRDTSEREEIERLRGELAEIERAIERLEAPDEELEPQPSDPEDSGVELEPFWDRERLAIPRALRGIEDKPFLASLWRRAYVGGYTELEYHSFEDGIQGIPEGFRMHRTNLFLFTDVADNVRFASEIEFETEFDGAENSNDIEVALEMAMLDWTIYEEFTLRGGVILPPLGRINVNHDGPVREFTERPLVSTFVIPTTLSEVGGGAHGVFSLSDRFALTYEAYAVNGFNLLDASGELATGPTEMHGFLREGRTALGGDVNDGIATTGRIGFEVADVVQVGGSWHVGTYDERGDNLLSLVSADLAWVAEPFSVEGEIAAAEFDRDRFARSAGVPDLYWGFYLQGAFGGMPAFLREAAPHVFGGDGARLSLALRWDWIDLDGDRGEIIEPGFSFRPVADTVFKFSYRFSLRSFGLRGVPGTETFDDDGFVFSLSTYF